MVTIDIVIVQRLKRGFDITEITAVLILRVCRTHILVTHSANCLAVRPESVGHCGVDTNEADEKFHVAPWIGVSEIILNAKGGRRATSDDTSLSILVNRWLGSIPPLGNILGVPPRRTAAVNQASAVPTPSRH